MALSARADIPWAEAKVRLAAENAALAARPQGHDGTYFVICTLYYTPMESGFTAERGFDVTPVQAKGLGGRTYGREFLATVKLEGIGRITEPVNGRSYIAYDGDNSYRYVRQVYGRGTNVLVPRQSAAARTSQAGFPPGTSFTIDGKDVIEVFESTDWKITDTGGGLKRWQIDLYWGEDEPLGPGRLKARPRGTTFEYGYSEARIKPPEKKKEEDAPPEETPSENAEVTEQKIEETPTPSPTATPTPTPIPEDV